MILCEMHLMCNVFVLFVSVSSQETQCTSKASSSASSTWSATCALKTLNITCAFAVHNMEHKAWSQLFKRWITLSTR